MLTAHPQVSRVDEPVRLAAAGLTPGADAILRVRTTDGSHRGWESWARFRADSSGGIDPAVQEPLDGTYSGVSATGLLWSMQPVDPPRESFFTRQKPIPLRMKLILEVPGEEPVETPFQRVFTDPSVKERVVPYDSGLAGTLYSPQEPAPGVIVVGGSDGGQQDHAAALLAAHGHTVLSLGYFGVEDRPAHLNHLELGYVRDAIAWLVEQPEVQGERVAFIGASRGAELALQVAALDSRISAVVAVAPSSIRQAGLTATYTDFTQPAWLLDGEPLPFVPGKMTARSSFGFAFGWLLRRPVRQRAMFERMLVDNEVTRAAAIEVERIAGPVLLLSGSDDQLWPSDRYGEQIMDRLTRDDSKHIVYPGAGHFCAFPYALPTLPPSIALSPAPRIVIDFGGTAPACAASADQSWAEILAFLGGGSADSRIA